MNARSVLNVTDLSRVFSDQVVGQCWTVCFSACVKVVPPSPYLKNPPHCDMDTICKSTCDASAYVKVYFILM